MSEYDCMICCMDYDKTDIYGWDECFPQHLFCLECLLYIYKNGAECPIDKRKISTVVKWNTEGNVVRFNDLVNFCMQCARKLENQYSFGYESCFDEHRYCENCAKKNFGLDFICYIDDNRSTNIIVKDPYNVTVVMEAVYFDTLELLSRNTKGYLIEKERYYKQEYPVHVCMMCADDLDGQIRFGFEDCFDKHRVCYKCLQYGIEYAPHCTICRRRSRFMCQRADMSVTVFDHEFYFALHTLLDEHKYDRTEIQSMIQSMLDTSEFNLNICLYCFINLEDKISYGHEDYSYNHRLCGRCVEERIISYNEHTIRTNILIKNKSREPVIVNLDLFYIIHYLDNEVKDCDKAQLLIERILTTKTYPLDVCHCCFCNLTGQSSYSYERCFNTHRMCFNCAMQVIGSHPCVLDAHINKLQGILKCWELNVKLDFNRFGMNVTEENVEKQVRTFTAMLFPTISLLYERRDNDSKVQTLINTMMSTLQFPLDICILCLDDISNKRKYGCSLCFKFHRTCEKCVIIVSDFNDFNYCCLWGNRIHLRIEDENKQIIIIDYKIGYFINYINRREPKSDKDYSVKKAALMTLKLPLNICMKCFNDLRDCSSYGYETCFAYHPFCERCIIEYNDECRICYRNDDHSHIKIRSNCGADYKVEKLFFKYINFLDAKLQDSEKWLLTKKEMLATLEYPIHACHVCMTSLDGVSAYGYEHCFDRHRMCQECALATMTTKKCLIDEISSNNIQIKHTNKETVTIDSMILQLIRFLHSNFPHSEKWRYMLANVSYSLQMCINCLTNLDNNRKYVYEEHFDYYRLCEKCMLEYVINDRCKITEMIMYKQDLIVEMENGTRSIIEYHFLEIIRYMKHGSRNKEDRECVLNKMWTTLEYPVNLCLECFKDIKCQTSFGVELCMDKHRLCQECFSVDSNNLQCPVSYFLQTHDKH